jgi:hypothetical protein
LNPRIALVIGNATYRDVALATAANDAGLVAQTLQAAGFDVTSRVGLPHPHPGCSPFGQIGIFTISFATWAS